MACDRCNRPTDTMFNKMPLCSPCQEEVKAHRLATRFDRAKAAPEPKLQGRKLVAARGGDGSKKKAK